MKNLVWVNLKKDFLVVKETLTRIGISSKRGKKLWQSCHILHKNGKYAIVHFKELFSLDGKPTNFDDSDLARRNTIINLLSEWGLVEVIDPETISGTRNMINQIKVISSKDKDEWELLAKYTIGHRN